MRGDRISPKITVNSKEMIRIEKNFSAKSFAFNFPILSFLENAGVKAELKAPSAKILLNMLGILKATKKHLLMVLHQEKLLLVYLLCNQVFC